MRFLNIGVSVLFLAVTVSYASYIDLTDESFSVINNHSYYEKNISDLNVTMGLSANPNGAELSWSESGIGIDYGWAFLDEEDEINWPEELKISFDKTVNLESVDLSNLYVEGVWVPGFFGFGGKWISWAEDGQYELSDGSTGIFSAENRDGNISISIDSEIDWITLSTGCLNLTNEFSVAGITVSSVESVPEASTAALLGTGLIISMLGVVGLKRRVIER